MNITLDQVMEVLESGREYVGFCLHCGAEADGVEPDAREYYCGHNEVYGCEELLIMLA